MSFCFVNSKSISIELKYRKVTVGIFIVIFLRTGFRSSICQNQDTDKKQKKCLNRKRFINFYE